MKYCTSQMQVTGRLLVNQRKRANQLRRTIERLGPAYVKVAQVQPSLANPPPLPLSLCIAGHALCRPPYLHRPARRAVQAVVVELACDLGRSPQALSTRVDILSPEYLLQIELLQDRVPPFPTREALEVMEQGAPPVRPAHLSSPTSSTVPRMTRHQAVVSAAHSLLLTCECKGPAAPCIHPRSTEAGARYTFRVQDLICSI